MAGRQGGEEGGAGEDVSTTCNCTPSRHLNMLLPLALALWPPPPAPPQQLRPQIQQQLPPRRPALRSSRHLRHCRRKRTLGQLLRLTRYLWYARPAFSIGFSVRPPPDTWPTVARQSLLTTCRQEDRACAMQRSAPVQPSGRLFLTDPCIATSTAGALSAAAAAAACCAA